jgi:hypothetical protein
VGLGPVVKFYEALKSAGDKPKLTFSALAVMASACESRVPAAITGSTNYTSGWKRRD